LFGQVGISNRQCESLSVATPAMIKATPK
jgi:hypothetical protein